MRKAICCLLLVMMPFSVQAEPQSEEYADLSAAKKAFESAYATNCTSAKDMAPIGPFSKRHFSASYYSSLAC